MKTCFTLIAVWIAIIPENIAISGVEFIMSFPNFAKANIAENKISLYLSTPVNHIVNVNITAPEYKGAYNINNNLILTPGTSTEVTINRVFRMPPGTSISARTLVITASDLIDVVGSNINNLRGDSFNAIPDNFLGKEYVAVSYKPKTWTLKYAGSFVTVSAGIRATSTQLAIKFPPWVNGERVFLNGSWYGTEECAEIWLKSLETLQIQSEHDLTGTFVRASQPVAVYSGVNRTIVYKENTLCVRSHLLDQMPSLDRAGLEYVAFDYPKRSMDHGSIYRIVATEPNTTVIIPGSYDRVMTKMGKHINLMFESKSFHFFRATKPVIVAAISLSPGKISSQLANPSLVILTPTEGSYQNTSFSYKMLSTSYVTIVAEKSVKNGIRFDHKPISAAWNPINGTTLYQAANVYVATAFTPHIIYHVDGGTFMAYLHTGQQCTAHGISLGLSPEVINPLTNSGPLCPAITTTQSSTLPSTATTTQTSTSPSTTTESCQMSTSVPGDGVDNDCDGRTDEETCCRNREPADDDNDGRVNEDCISINGTDETPCCNSSGQDLHICKVVGIFILFEKVQRGIRQTSSSVIELWKETRTVCSHVCVQEFACWGINFDSTQSDAGPDVINCEILVGAKGSQQTESTWEYHGVLKRTFWYS